MIVQCDTRQKLNHHRAKEEYFKSHGIQIVQSKLLVGDYTIPGKGSISVDTKASIQELYGNLIQDHERFRAECKLAQECGVKLYILVENKDNITSIDGVKHWKNPRMFTYYKAKRKYEANGLKPPKPPVSNVQLVKVMWSMTQKYGVEFLFCAPEDAGAKVIELLTQGERNESNANTGNA